jgi:AcrR family transcriptional regulator
MDPDAQMGRVAAVALPRLVASGYAATTLDEIADAAGLTVAQVRTLVGDEEGLMARLAGTMLAALGDILAEAAAVDLRDPEALRQLIENYLDTLVAHRGLLRVVLSDATAAGSPTVRAVRRAMLDLTDRLAEGTGDRVDNRIRAASALGAVQSAVLEMAALDPATVRDVIVDASVAILLA